MNIEEMKKYIQQRKLETVEHADEDLMRKEHLKRKYLRLHHMEGKIRDYKKLKEITRMKRQILKMMSR